MPKEGGRRRATSLLGYKPPDLVQSPKGAEWKVTLGWWLRRKTGIHNRWLGGSPSSGLALFRESPVPPTPNHDLSSSHPHPHVTMQRLTPSSPFPTSISWLLTLTTDSTDGADGGWHGLLAHGITKGEMGNQTPPNFLREQRVPSTVFEAVGAIQVEGDQAGVQ